MGVVSTNTMVAGTTGSGFIGYFRNQAGSMSPTTTDAIGSTPTIDYVAHLFGFTVIQLLGNVDNSSITGMILTPSSGSAITFTFNSYVQDGSVTRFASGSGSNLSSGTTYTVQLLCTTTNMNTEGTTLERRNPKDMNDFYGATRNVPPVSGAFKLSWLKNAVKYKHTTSITAGIYTAGFPANFTVRGYHIFFCGSINTQTIGSIINFYEGKLIYGIFDNYDQGSATYALSLLLKTTSGSGSTPLGVNSQWYKLKVGSLEFYREDATFSATTTSPYWTSFVWNTGTTQNLVQNTTYAIELTC